MGVVTGLRHGGPLNRRVVPALVVFGAIVALTSGCSTSPPTAASATMPIPSLVAAATAQPAPTPTATATPAPTPSPTPGPSPKALCSKGDGEFPPKKCPLAPGTYSSAPFAPAFRFAVGAGWTNSLAGINAGQITREDSPGRMGFGWATGMVAEDGTQVGKTTDALLAYLAARPGITMSPATPVTIGGMPARSIDFTSSQDFLMRVGKSGVSFGPGEKVRAIFVDVDGVVVLLALESYTPTSFDADMTAMQPILDSIVWN
jgi:hypothetical protein